MQYRHDAQLAYQNRMLKAHAGRGDYPKIRTFQKSDHSTNSVFKDLEAAERLMGIKSDIDISDITWEQKERVLRYLFAKMNGAKDKRHTSAPALPPPEPTQDAWGEFDQGPDSTFLTQSQMDPTMDRLPNIHQSGTEVM